MTTLAIAGGKPVRTRPFPDRNPFGPEDERQVLEALRQQQLFSPKGRKVREFQLRFGELYTVPYVITSTSGTAAIHTALGVLRLEPGDEIITTPITDVGTVAPIILQGCIPVFADVDPLTCNLDPDDVEQKITDRTRAIIVVHCWGQAADMDRFVEIARKHKLLLIEDCAQAHYTRYKGKLLGTFGDLGTFSLQESKHLQCGDGGITIMQDKELHDLAALFTDKGCSWTDGRMARLKYVMTAPCYRMTELQGAVLLAQLPHLPEIVRRRQLLGERLRAYLTDVPGVIPPGRTEGGEHSYWLFPLLLDKDVLGVTPEIFAASVAAEGVPVAGNWIGKPLYLLDALQQQVTFGTSHFPFASPYVSHPVRYEQGLCPRAEQALKQLRTISIHERYTDEDIDDIVQAIRKVAESYAARRSRKVSGKKHS